VFPGIGLGAIAVQAHSLPDAVFSAAARAVYGVTGRANVAGAPIFPPLSRLREVSYAVAVAVGRALIDAGAASAIAPREIEDRVANSMWEPDYLRYRAG
jgi:malate dehydrogenase (oxaloacetate-decarboxylating)